MNIGLARNDGLPDNTPGQVLRELGCYGRLSPIVRLSVKNSNTEKTLVLCSRAPSGYSDGFLDLLSHNLGQDCIAIRNDETGEGRLVGPNAEKWGAFNPDYFLEV